jgi:hypothetical protein
MPPGAGSRPWTRPVITETRADNFTRIREPMRPSVRPGQRPHGRVAQPYRTIPADRESRYSTPGRRPDATEGWRPSEAAAGHSRDPRRQLHRYPVAETSSEHAGAAWRATGTGAHRPRASSRAQLPWLPQNHPADFPGACRRQAARRPEANHPSPRRPCHPGGRHHRHRPRHRGRTARGPAPGWRVHGAVGLIRDRRLWADHGEAAAVSGDLARAGNQGFSGSARQRPGRRGDHPLQ